MKDEQREKLFELIGDPDAVAMLETLGKASQAADDIYDGDGDVSPQQSILAVLQSLLDELPSNQFYMDNYRVITPFLRQAYYGWDASNMMRVEPGIKQRVVAFTIRDLLACLLYTSPSPRDRTRSRMPSSA